MTNRTRWTARLRMAGMMLLPACADPAGPPGDDLLFLRQGATSPALATTQVSFVARRGQSIEVRLPYVNGYDCLRFRLDEESLLMRPDGRPFLPGDTITITVRVVDPALYNFEFSPAGLRFDPAEPAELRVSYRYADRDVDGDGDVDEQDEAKLRSAGFWRQETASTSWVRVGTVRLDVTQEMRAELNGFTRYALASN